MHIFYHLLVLLGAISATVTAAILPVPTPTAASNDETLNITGALGINCRGSSRCHGSAAAQYLVQLINKLPDGVFYVNQQQIACMGTICAFLQSTDGKWSQDIKSLAYYIQAHGCMSCGSVPVHFPESNNVRNGELTFNYVQHRCPQSGVCPYWGVSSVISTISTASRFSVSSISHESRASISSVISTVSTASHFSVSSISHESRASISSSSREEYLATHTPILRRPNSVCEIVPMFIGGIVGGMAVVGFMTLIGFCWTWCRRERRYSGEHERLIHPPKTPPPRYYEHLPNSPC